MNRENVIAFLRAHQPMVSNRVVDDETLELLDEARKYVAETGGDAESVSLLLGTLGEGEGHGLYPEVVHVLASLPREVITPVVLSALERAEGHSLFWVLDLASEVRDKRLVGAVAQAFDRAFEEDRPTAVAALQFNESEEALGLLLKLEGRADVSDGVRGEIKEAIEWLGARDERP